MNVATTGAAGEQECDFFLLFFENLTKASPPVGVVASSSTPSLYSKSVSHVRQNHTGNHAALVSK